MAYAVRIAPRVVADDNVPEAVWHDLLGHPDQPQDEGKSLSLAQNPSLGKALAAPLNGLWRITLTSRYRAIYRVYENPKVVAIVMIGLRRAPEPYRQLERLLASQSFRELMGKAGIDLPED